MTIDQLTQIAAIIKTHHTITPAQLASLLGTPLESLPMTAQELQALCDTPPSLFEIQRARESLKTDPDLFGPNPNYKGPR